MLFALQLACKTADNLCNAFIFLMHRLPFGRF